MGGRISASVEPGHHVRQAGRRHRQEPGRAREVEIEAEVCLLELLGGRGCRLVLLAVAGVEEIKESRAVRCELLLLLLLLLLPGLGRGPPPTLQHLSFPGGLFHCRITIFRNFIKIKFCLLTGRHSHTLRLCFSLPDPVRCRVCLSRGRAGIGRGMVRLPLGSATTEMHPHVAEEVLSVVEVVTTEVAGWVL